MNYKNAGDILPEALLKELQQYAAGTLLYVPHGEEKRTWGEVSGYRHFLTRRNQLIVNMFLHGSSIDHLSEEFCLSEETIKKIVYTKKSTNKLDYYPTSTSAIEYSEAGMLEEWLHTYLLFNRKNKVFSDGLRLLYRFYIGPIMMPLSLFCRSSGPEESMKWQVDPIVFDNKVKGWTDRINCGEEVPPLIINYEKGKFEINCDNPLFEAMKKREINEHNFIIWITEKADHDIFLKEYSKYR